MTTELGDPLDVLFVATKATGLATALGRVSGTPGLIVPLLNGLEHLDVLRARFGSERVAAGVIRIESDRPAAGVIVQTSPRVRVDMAAGAQPALPGRLLRAAARRGSRSGSAAASARCCGRSSPGSTRWR